MDVAAEDERRPFALDRLEDGLAPEVSAVRLVHAAFGR